MLTDPTFLVSMTQEEKHYYIALYIFFAVGALMLLVAFLGCCGAFRESQCMLVSVRWTAMIRTGIRNEIYKYIVLLNLVLLLSAGCVGGWSCCRCMGIP
jgi:uncharacterized membrane protein